MVALVSEGRLMSRLYGTTNTERLMRFVKNF